MLHTHTYTWCWCWCGSVLKALLPATSPNSVFLLPLLQVVSISGQPRRAYCNFSEPEPRSVGGASLSRDHLCATVFLLWCSTEPRDDSAHFQETTVRLICSTSNALVNRRNIHHRPTLLWRFRDSGAGHRTAYLLTYKSSRSGAKHQNGSSAGCGSAPPTNGAPSAPN